MTGYLIIGIFAGPSFAEILGMPALISWTSLNNLTFLSEIALALIMFAIGGQFRSEYLRRWGRQLFTLSCFEIGITFLFVSLIALAYSVSRSIRRFSVLTGTGAFLAGYMLTDYLTKRLEPLLAVLNSHTPNGMISIPWGHLAIPFIIAPLFIVPAFILSDRLSEV